jgi:hypothetical protein
VFRLLALVAAIGLLVLPAVGLFGTTVPVPQFRARDYTDFLFFAETIAVIYGGVVLGVAVYWLRMRRARRSVRPAGVFQAGVAGAGIAAFAVVAASGIYGLVALGSFERGVGNLWGLIVIFTVVLGAIVAAGLALLWVALRRPPSGGPTLGPWSSGSGVGRLPAG